MAGSGSAPRGAEAENGAGESETPCISNHIEPQGPPEIARLYVRELFCGINDGIITTFAVISGVARGGLSLRVVVINGAADLFADGLSMAVSNFLSVRAH